MLYCTWFRRLPKQALESPVPGGDLVYIASSAIELPGSNKAWPRVLKEFFHAEVHRMSYLTRYYLEQDLILWLPKHNGYAALLREILGCHIWHNQWFSSIEISTP